MGKGYGEYELCHFECGLLILVHSNKVLQIIHFYSKAHNTMISICIYSVLGKTHLPVTIISET